MTASSKENEGTETATDDEDEADDEDDEDAAKEELVEYEKPTNAPLLLAVTDC